MSLFDAIVPQPVQAFSSAVAKVVDSITGLIPDKRARAEAKERLEHELVTTANTALLAQLEINKTEAAHRSLFVAGWRPFIGWTCGLGIFWEFLVRPILGWIILLQGGGPELLPPSVVNDYLFELMTGMLGIAGLRTFEKMRGVARAR